MAILNTNFTNLTTYPNSFSRQEPTPLEAHSLFTSKTDAENYAKNNPVAYVGQIIVVIDATNKVCTPYVISDTTGTLGEIGGNVDLSNYVDKTTEQTISGAKTFTAESKFTHTTYAPTWVDIASGIGKSSCFTRGAFMQLITGQILLPNAVCTNAGAGVTGGYETNANVLKFQTMTASSGQPAVTTVATIDSEGVSANSFKMISGTAVKATWKYNSSTDCVELVW